MDPGPVQAKPKENREQRGACGQPGGVGADSSTERFGVIGVPESQGLSLPPGVVSQTLRPSADRGFAAYADLPSAIPLIPAPQLPRWTHGQALGCNASAIPDAHALIAAWSRKSPSSPRNASRATFWAGARCFLSSFPANTR